MVFAMTTAHFDAQGSANGDQYRPLLAVSEANLSHRDSSAVVNGGSANRDCPQSPARADAPGSPGAPFARGRAPAGRRGFGRGRAGQS